MNKQDYLSLSILEMSKTVVTDFGMIETKIWIKNKNTLHGYR